ERLGYRGAVHLDQRPPRPLGMGVDRVGDDLLPGPALALDEDRRLARGRGLDHRPDALDRLGLPDQLMDAAGERELLFEAFLPGDEPAALEGLADQVEDLVGGEGLRHVVVGAALDRVDGGRDRALAGDDDHLGRGPALLHAVEQLEARDAWQREVGEDDLVLLPLELGDRLDRVLRGLDDVAVGRERDSQRLADRRLVIDDEQSALPPHGELPAYPDPPSSPQVNATVKVPDRALPAFWGGDSRLSGL